MAWTWLQALCCPRGHGQARPLLPGATPAEPHNHPESLHYTTGDTGGAGLTCSNTSTLDRSLRTSSSTALSVPGEIPALSQAGPAPHPTPQAGCSPPWGGLSLGRAWGTALEVGLGPHPHSRQQGWPISAWAGAPRPPPPRPHVPTVLSCPSRGPRRALGARLSTAHYYSRYEFEVSQRVPKVIMSRRQQRCGVSWLRGQGRGEDPGAGVFFHSLRWDEAPPLGRPPHNAPEKSPPLSPLGKIPVSAQVREMACSPGWELQGDTPPPGHSSKGGATRTFTCCGVRGYPGGPPLGQAGHTFCRWAVPFPTLAPVTPRSVDAVLGARAPSSPALVHVCRKTGVS